MVRTSVPTVRRALTIALALALLGAISALLAAQGNRPSWTASRQVLVRTWNVDGLVLSGQPAQLTDEDRVSATKIATSYEVFERAARTARDLGSVKQLQDSVSAKLEAGSNLITITAEAPSAQLADRRAQGVAEAFSAATKERQFSLADDLIRQRTSEEVKQRARAVREMDPVQIYRGSEPTNGRPSLIRSAASGAVLGLGVGALIVAAWTFLPRLRSRSQGTPAGRDR